MVGMEVDQALEVVREAELQSMQTLTLTEEHTWHLVEVLLQALTEDPELCFCKIFAPKNRLHS